MKKILLGVMMFAMCAFVSSCASKADKQCSVIAEAMVANNWEEVSTLSNQLYATKADCSASNLVDLSLAFNGVANQTTDNAARYETIKKVIDCYESAMSKDEATAKKCYTVSTVDMASIVAQYKEMLPQFEAAIAAEQNGGTVEEAATEETEEAATEEATSEE